MLILKDRIVNMQITKKERNKVLEINIIKLPLGLTETVSKNESSNSFNTEKMLKAIEDWEIIREYTAISYLYTVTIKTDSCVESFHPTEVRDFRTKMKLHEGNNYSLKKID